MLEEADATEYLKLWLLLGLLEIERLLCNTGQISSASDLTKAGDRGLSRIQKWVDAQSADVRALREFKAFDLSFREFCTNAVVAIECLRDRRDVADSDLSENIFVIYDRASTSLDLLVSKLRAMGVTGQIAGSNTSLRLWDPSFSLGIPDIDRHRRAIVTLIELAIPNSDSVHVALPLEDIRDMLFKFIRAELGIETPIINQMLAAGVASAQEHKTANADLDNFIEYAQSSQISIRDSLSRLVPWYIERLVLYGEGMKNFCVNRPTETGTK